MTRLQFRKIGHIANDSDDPTITNMFYNNPGIRRNNPCGFRKERRKGTKNDTCRWVRKEVRCTEYGEVGRIDGLHPGAGGVRKERRNREKE